MEDNAIQDNQVSFVLPEVNALFSIYLGEEQYRITQYNSLGTNVEMLEALNQSKPVVIGMTLYDSFMTVNTKRPELSLPGDYDFVIGGHAVCVVGYSLPKQQFIIKNSFGKDWGDSGYGWMPFEYFEKWIFDPVVNENNTLLT